MVTVADDLETAPAGPVPQPDGIIPAGTGQQAAIGTPPHATHAPRMAAPELWRPSLCEAFPLPQADDAIEAGTRNCCAIGTPVQVVEGGCVPLQHAQPLAPLHVKARPSTTPLWPESTSRVRPSWASHSRMVWSLLPLASVLPSGLHATQFTCSVCPESRWRRRRRPCSPHSQSLTLPSQLALARTLPSGAKARPRTQLLCASSVCTQRVGPLGCLSHSRIVPTVSPLASRCPSGLQASAKTAPGCGSSSSRVPSCASQHRTVASAPPLAN